VIVELCESSVERQVTFSDAEATPNSEPNPPLSHECADIAAPSASMAMEDSEQLKTSSNPKECGKQAQRSSQVKLNALSEMISLLSMILD
jgi:hypothetical protein